MRLSEICNGTIVGRRISPALELIGADGGTRTVVRYSIEYQYIRSEPRVSFVAVFCSKNRGWRPRWGVPSRRRKKLADGNPHKSPWMVPTRITHTPLFCSPFH